MTSILMSLGASRKDLQGLKSYHENLGPDPTLPFRKTATDYVGYNLIDGKIRRLQHRPFILKEEDGFYREDSGIAREYVETAEEAVSNTAYKAIIRFKAIVTANTHISTDFKNWISTVFLLRVITNNEFLGEPAIEGVTSRWLRVKYDSFYWSQQYAF